MLTEQIEDLDERIANSYAEADPPADHRLGARGRAGHLRRHRQPPR